MGSVKNLLSSSKQAGRQTNRQVQGFYVRLSYVEGRRGDTSTRSPTKQRGVARFSSC